MKADEKLYRLPPGTVLDDRYVLEDVLGEGGFGITYIGRNRRVGIPVAIKEYFCRDYMERDVSESNEIRLPDAADAVRLAAEKRKFLKEARSIGDFAGEDSVVGVSDYFEENGTAYIVMEYLEGRTLRDCVKEDGRFGGRELFARLRPLIASLAEIHAAGVIHRDISPDNIMVLAGGQPVLMDFGAAKIYTEETPEEAVVLKNGYAPREQYSPDGEQGPWTDVYALCATMYFCLTTQVPEHALTRVMHDELKKPSEIGIRLDPEAEEILMKGLAVNPADRFSDAGELLGAVTKYLDSLKGREEKKKAGMRTAVSVMAAGFVALVVILGLFWYRNHRAEILLRGVRTESFTLTPPEQMPVRQFYENAEIYRERFGILAGDSEYLWEETDGQIRVTAPLSVFAGKDAGDVLHFYIERSDPMRYYDGKRQSQIGLVSPSDFSELSVETGEIPGLDRSAFGLPAAGAYPYLAITFSAGGADTYAPYLAEQGLSFFLGAHVTERRTMAVNLWSAGDGQHAYAAAEPGKAQLLRLLMKNLSEENRARKLDLQYEWQVNRETPEGAVIPGANQCAWDAFSGETVLLKLSCEALPEEEREKGGVWYNTIALIKARLDQLGIPYAAGYAPSDPRCLLIRAPREALWGIAARTLTAEGISLRSRSGTEAAAGEALQDLQITAEADGSYAIHALLPEGESFAEKWKETAASREYLVYLYAGEVPLAVAPLSDTEGRELIFRDFVIEGKSRLTAEDAAFASYLEFLFATMKGMPEHLALELDMEQFLLPDGRIDPDGSFVCDRVPDAAPGQGNGMIVLGGL